LVGEEEIAANPDGTVEVFSSHTNDWAVWKHAYNDKRTVKELCEDLPYILAIRRPKAKVEPKAVEPDAKGVTVLQKKTTAQIMAANPYPIPAPRWIPVAERLPEDNKPFWGYEVGQVGVFPYHRGQTDSILKLFRMNNKQWTHWQYMEVPPEPVAKTQQELDEEACQAAYYGLNKPGNYHTFREGFFAYARKEKK